MSRAEIRAFAEDHLDAAGLLLAARHREHRAAAPLLSKRFEDPEASRGEVASLWAEEHASGAVALRDGQLAGFLVGTRKNERMWGANVWVEAAGYAVDEPELVRTPSRRSGGSTKAARATMSSSRRATTTSTPGSG